MSSPPTANKCLGESPTLRGLVCRFIQYVSVVNICYLVICYRLVGITSVCWGCFPRLNELARRFAVVEQVSFQEARKELLIHAYVWTLRHFATEGTHDRHRYLIVMSFGWCAFAIGVSSRTPNPGRGRGRQSSHRGRRGRRPHKDYNRQKLRDNFYEGQTLDEHYVDPFAHGGTLYSYLEAIFEAVKKQTITVGEPRYREYGQVLTEIMGTFRSVRRIQAHDIQPEGCPIPVCLPDPPCSSLYPPSYNGAPAQFTPATYAILRQKCISRANGWIGGYPSDESNSDSDSDYSQDSEPDSDGSPPDPPDSDVIVEMDTEIDVEAVSDDGIRDSTDAEITDLTSRVALTSSDALAIQLRESRALEKQPVVEDSRLDDGDWRTVVESETSRSRSAKCHSEERDLRPTKTTRAESPEYGEPQEECGRSRHKRRSASSFKPRGRTKSAH